MNHNVEIDLVSYSPLLKWSPKVGDIVFKEGFWTRWCGVVDGIKDESVHVKKAGNIHLLLMGEYKDDDDSVINVRKLKSERQGKYYVVSQDGTYYV